MNILKEINPIVRTFDVDHYLHIAVIINKNRNIIVSAFNDAFHAEVNAINKLNKLILLQRIKKRTVQSLTLIVIRVDFKGILHLSKPCSDCKRCIDHTENIKNVFWSTDFNSYDSYNY